MTLYDDVLQHLAPTPDLPLLDLDLDAITRLFRRWAITSSWQQNVREFYPDAAYVELDMSSEYDDEGGYYNVIEHCNVFNASETEITDTISEDAQETFRESLWEMETDTSVTGLCIDFRLTRLTAYDRTTLQALLRTAEHHLNALPDACFGASAA